MPITLDHIICDVPNSGYIYPGACSNMMLDSVGAARFAHNAGGHLQGIGEAVIFRYFNLPDAYMHQKTRTLNLVYKKGKKYFSAFVEAPDAEISMCLFRNGVSYNNKDKNLLCSVKDAFICDLLRLAKRAHRIVPLRNERRDLRTRQTKGSSVYGRDSHAIVLFGHPEISELNASIMYKHDCYEGFIHELTLDEVAGILDDNLHVAIFPMSLGGGPGVKEMKFRDLVANAGLHHPYISYGQFNGLGRARAVAKVNFS